MKLTYLSFNWNCKLEPTVQWNILQQFTSKLNVCYLSFLTTEIREVGADNFQEKIGHPLYQNFLDPPMQTKLENERISQMKEKWLMVK